MVDDLTKKNNVVTLVLCICLGYLGIHHYYLGNTKKGIIYTFTVGIFGIGWIVDIVILILQVCKDTQKANEIAEKNRLLAYEEIIKVAGTSYHQKELVKIAKNGMNCGAISNYGGMTTREIKAYGRVGQIDQERLNRVNLQQYDYEGEKAIRVLIDDFEGNLLEIGNIPKEEVNKLLHFLQNKDNYNFVITGWFVGGKYKEYDAYDEKMTVTDLTIGIRLKISIYNKSS